MEYDLLKCNVIDGHTKKVQLFTYSVQTPGDKTGEDMMNCLKFTLM